MAVRRPDAVRGVRLGGPRRVRRRLPDRAGVRRPPRAAPGVRVRQGTTVTGLLVDGDRVTGVRLADGTESSADTVVVATGVWSRPFLAPYGVDVPIRVAASRS